MAQLSAYYLKEFRAPTCGLTQPELDLQVQPQQVGALPNSSLCSSTPQTKIIKYTYIMEDKKIQQMI